MLAGGRPRLQEAHRPLLSPALQAQSANHILLQGARLPSLVAACPGDGLWWIRRAGGGQEVVWRPRHWSTPKPTWSLSCHLMLLKRMPPHLPPGRGSYPEPRDKVPRGRVQHDLKSQCRQELGPQEERARLGVRVCVSVSASKHLGQALLCGSSSSAL